MIRIRFILFYFLVSSCELFFAHNLQKSMELIFKPFICISLILFLVDNKYFKDFTVIYLALICGFIGDLLLILPEYFIGGLVAFLCGHIMYIYAFSKQNNFKLYINKFSTWLVIILVTAYLLIFYHYIKFNLAQLQLPVLIYMIVISLMFISAYFRKRLKGYYYVIIGAINFIISDSLIAINQFVTKFLYDNELILITYIIAQFLIIFGFTKYNQNK